MNNYTDLAAIEKKNDESLELCSLKFTGKQPDSKRDVKKKLRGGGGGDEELSKPPG